jgi:hypothetical protein
LNQSTIAFGVIFFTSSFSSKIDIIASTPSPELTPFFRACVFFDGGGKLFCDKVGGGPKGEHPQPSEWGTKALHFQDSDAV